MESIRESLFAMRDEGYRKFIVSLIPNVDKERIIGIRTPALRKLAVKISGTDIARSFINDLPHEYYEENNLHAFLLEQMTDRKLLYAAIQRFLPHIDNWSTCDSFSPGILAENKEELSEYINIWIKSEHVYTVRFAVCMLMKFFLDKDFSDIYVKKVSEICSDEYYVNMGCAWYFATALAKQYDSVIPYFQSGELPLWVHNKAISKASESLRISDETKKYLKTLKRA
ncbi:MAG: DNA alkylation repair protein [Ruminococcaceae bacterium]|nr:DNA alkylation repair protein [Oscillospiraceae bacterium]